MQAPPSTERRREPRVPVYAPVTLTCLNGGTLVYSIEDLSARGVAVVHDWHRLRAQSCEVRFDLPRGRTVVATCREVYRIVLAERGPGRRFRSGLEFTAIAADHYAELAAYVADHGS